MAAVVLVFVVHATLTMGASHGRQWQAAGLQGMLVHSIALNRHSGETAFAGAHDGVFRLAHDGSWQRVLASGDVWSVALLPDGRTVLAAGEDGRVSISPDQGSHWRSAAVSSQGAYAVTADPAVPRRLLAGAGGGIYVSLDGGLHWRRRLALGNAAGTAFAWAPRSANTVFAGAVAGAVGGSTGVFVSHDAGMTWQAYGRGLDSGGGIMSLHVTANGHLVAGTMGHATWTVTGADGAWYRLARGMPSINNHIAAIAGVPGHPRTLFAGSLSNGVYRTTNDGSQWTNISDGLVSTSNANTVLSLTYDGQRHTLYAGTADGVYVLNSA